MAGIDSSELHVPEMFTKLLAERILPAEQLFDLRDFLVLHELGIEFRHLPSDDVEDLLLFFQSQAIQLDLSDRKHRERLGHEVRRYLADPARKYQQELDRLSREKAELRDEYQRRLECQQLAIGQTEEKIETLTKALDAERESRTKEIDRLNAEREREIEDHRQERLKRSTWWRLALLFLVLIALWLGVGWLATTYGDGNNTYVRILTAIPLFALCGTLVLALGWFLLGRERLMLLPWGVSRIFKADDKD